MQLQLALDIITLEDALTLLGELSDVIDIVEVGTPFIISEGLNAVRKIRAAHPDLKILADLKIMDAGRHETQCAIDAGADIVTVLGVSSDATISAAIEAADAAGKSIMADMIDVPDIPGRAAQIDALGAHYICVHTAFDVQHTGQSPLAELQQLSRVCKRSQPAVAGGVRLETLGAIVREKPAIIVVGGGITGQRNKRSTALAMRDIIQGGGL